jgi:hypothetical protein
VPLANKAAKAVRQNLVESVEDLSNQYLPKMYQPLIVLPENA